MDFQFQGVIDSNEHQALWTKTIYSLSTVSDAIKVRFEAHRMILSSNNTTKTSLLQVSFSANRFFKEYKLCGVEACEILVNSKALALIFRNYRLVSDDVEFFKLTINEGGNSKRINRSRNKLFIEIMDKVNLKKNYTLNFVKCRGDFELNIDKKYKQDLLTQVDSTPPGDKINYLMIETAILKNFLDMFPSSLEDFKIEVNTLLRKLNLIGFNKQQLVTGSKESQTLKQPMSLTVGVSLSDILGDNFPDTDTRDKVDITFKLKDFKTFINLNSSIQYSANKNSNDFQFAPQRPLNYQNFIEILFKQPGTPLLFSRRCEVPNSYSTKQITNTVDNINEEFELFSVELILLSDFEGDVVTVPRNDAVIPSIQVLKNDVDVQETSAPVISESSPVSKKRRKNQDTTTRRFNLEPFQKDNGITSAHRDPASSREPSSLLQMAVLWNESDPRPLEGVGSAFMTSDTLDSAAENIAYELITNETNREENDEEAFGPTQGVYKMKGLFD